MSNLSGGGIQGFGEKHCSCLKGELKDALMPFVNKNFRTATGNTNTALAGLSLGGLQTLYAGVKQRSLFLPRRIQLWLVCQPAGDVRCMV